MKTWARNIGVVVIGTVTLIVAAAILLEPRTSSGETCYADGERSRGNIKTCYYSCTCGMRSLTVKEPEPCPLFAKFNC